MYTKGLHYFYDFYYLTVIKENINKYFPLKAQNHTENNFILAE